MTAAHRIFWFCSSLYQKVALIITTNLRFADLTQVFGDERLTAALLDRLTHKAHILEFSGAESYRFRERMRRETRRANIDCDDRVVPFLFDRYSQGMVLVIHIRTPITCPNH